MKTVFITTAILNLSLVVLAFICAFIGAIDRSVDLLVASAILVLVSIFPTTMMLALCNDYKEADK